MDKGNLKLCLIESNYFIREGLKSFLSQTRYKVHADFLNIQELIEHKTQNDCTCDIVIIGINTDHDPRDVDNTLKVLKLNLPNARIVIISPTLDENLILDFSKNADGYILNDISSEALVGSLDLIMLGEKIFPTSMVNLISKTHHSWEILKNENNNANNILSKRENDILECLVNGDPNKVIANHLSITDATVKVHLKAILRKLGVSNRTQAALWAVNNGALENNATNAL